MTILITMNLALYIPCITRRQQNTSTAITNTLPQTHHQHTHTHHQQHQTSTPTPHWHVETQTTSTPLINLCFTTTTTPATLTQTINTTGTSNNNPSSNKDTHNYGHWKRNTTTPLSHQLRHTRPTPPQHAATPPHYHKLRWIQHSPHPQTRVLC